MRVLFTSCAVFTAAAATAALAGAQSTSSPTARVHDGTPSQAFFHDALAKDARTVSALRKALQDNAAIIDPATQYADLTGDGKSDAVVRVHSTGVAGVTAVFVFSSDGSAKGHLRVLFRSQALYRAITAAVDQTQLQIDEPLYQAGDDPCCPKRLTRRRYRFSTKSRTFSRTSRETITL